MTWQGREIRNRLKIQRFQDVQPLAFQQTCPKNRSSWSGFRPTWSEIESIRKTALVHRARRRAHLQHDVGLELANRSIKVFVMALSRIPVWIAQRTPRRVKAAVHNVRFLDRTLMSLYGSLIKDKVMSIEEGPMRGIKLAASQHTSHAHINGTYEREVQDAIDHMVQPGDICYDLGASIGYMTLLMARKANPGVQPNLRESLLANAFVEASFPPNISATRSVKWIGTRFVKW